MVRAISHTLSILTQNDLRTIFKQRWLRQERGPPSKSAQKCGLSKENPHKMFAFKVQPMLTMNPIKFVNIRKGF